MRRLGLFVLTLGLLASPTWSDERFRRDELEADLELSLVLRPPGPIEAGTPIRADLRIANRSEKQTYPVVMPALGCQDGVTEPYVWFTARLRPVGKTAFARVDPVTTGGLCGTGDWSWHRHVRDLKPGDVLELEDRLRPLEFEVTEPGTLEITAHYGFLAERAQPRLPGAEGPDDLGPMKGVPRFELVSKPVRVEVVRTLYMQAERGPKRLRSGREVRLSSALGATLVNAADTAVDLSANGYSVWVEFRTRDGKPAPGIERKPLGPLLRPARRVEGGASATVLGADGWYDERLVAGKIPAGGILARIVLRLESEPPRTLRSRWLRID